MIMLNIYDIEFDGSNCVNNDELSNDIPTICKFLLFKPCQNESFSSIINNKYQDKSLKLSICFGSKYNINDPINIALQLSMIKICE